MKWMQDDPYLFIRLAISNTIRSVLIESSDPGSTGPDNANGLGYLESTTSLINPLVGGKTQ